MRRTIAALAVMGVVLLGCSSENSEVSPTAAPVVSVDSSAETNVVVGQQGPPHVFVIMLENTNYEVTFRPKSKAQYLSHDLVAQGALLTHYYGITHHSLPNYLAQISGQAPNSTTQGDCGVFEPFVQTDTEQYDQAVGDGCVYPARVRTIADQLHEAGLTWRAYAQDMAASKDAPSTCRHPVVGEDDPTGHARDGDNFATKHVPFLYFHSIIDSPDCAKNVVDLHQLDDDLNSVDTTPNLSYIVPGLCDDGHDDPCIDGSKGGLKRADQFLQKWVPRILASPGFAADGLLIITFDEAGSSDTSWCCGTKPAPNLDDSDNIGGGRVGAVVIGASVTPGTIDDTPYDHYSLLCSLERLWGLDLLGLAAHPSTACFGDELFTANPTFATP